MNEILLAAVDGCRGGWVIAQAACSSLAGDKHERVVSSEGTSHQPEMRVRAGSLRLTYVREFGDVLQCTEDCESVLVDMPIGLSGGDDSAQKGGATDKSWPRACDIAAKEALKGKRSSLFLAPPRGTLGAENPRDFQQLHRQITGVGASLPVWGIVPKIVEVDLQLTPEVQRKVHEFHPELAWCRLAGRSLAKKRSREGAEQRWRILRQWFDDSDLESAEHWRDDFRGKIGEDDLLDALVGIVSGLTLGRFRLPTTPSRDARGLLMEIYY
ncbi:MAG: DUF429 domain-containing protein [Planctomycetota bacterium]